jgi:hypothetical protein
LTVLAAIFRRPYAVEKGETRLDDIGANIDVIAHVANRERHFLSAA